jgi:uncharacterized protein YycO
MSAAVNLQFSTKNDFGGDAIRFFDHGKYSHVDAILSDGSLLGARNDLLAGIPPGVRIRPADYDTFTLVKRVSLACSDAQAAQFDSFLRSQIGKPYDMTAIIAFVVGRDWRSEDSWFCSELAAAAMESAGIFPYKLADTFNKITPADLLLAISVLVDVGP